MKDNKLTDEIISKLKQGTKIKFKRFKSNLEYIGRIEVNKFGELYFVNEHCYENDKITYANEPLRFYNRLDRFFHFDYFEIL